MKEFDPEQLEEFDGKDGKPVYIVHRGRVFDVTASKLWRGGLHMRRHHAGRDLTTDFQAAPHGLEVLERYPQVGVIKERQAAERPMPEGLARVLERFPMLKRHPHPMTVHFPIAFAFAATGFNVLYLLTGVKALETTALHCLVAAVLFLPLVMMTGLFTWWLNYLARPVRAVTIKVWCSLALWLLAIVACVWRIAVPSLLDSLDSSGGIYLALILSFVPLVSVIGWFGASLTFPIERE
jgi:predicted heme/steroid binding protein/uncharacterized membrane protein